MTNLGDIDITAAVLSRKKHNDSVRDKLRAMMNTEELQKKKEFLLLKKKSLCKEQHVELQSTRSKLSTTQQKMFDQICPLMTNIHRLQLQVLELGEKVKKSDVAKERNVIMQALSLVCDQNDRCRVDMLREWYKQMMYHCVSHADTNAPIEHNMLYFNVSNTPEAWPEPSQRHMSPRRALSFCTTRKGVSLKVDITATSLLSSMPAELEARSSLYLAGLTEEVQICAAEQRDSSYLVASVIWRLLDQQIVTLVSPETR